MRHVLLLAVETPARPMRQCCRHKPGKRQVCPKCQRKVGLCCLLPEGLGCKACVPERTAPDTLLAEHARCWLLGGCRAADKETEDAWAVLRTAPGPANQEKINPGLVPTGRGPVCAEVFSPPRLIPEIKRRGGNGMAYDLETGYDFRKPSDQFLSFYTDIQSSARRP